MKRKTINSAGRNQTNKSLKIIETFKVLRMDP
jgi:hypothetical protein